MIGFSGTTTVVVIGGTGNFGERICRRLVGESNFTLVIASRSLSKSQKLVDELRSQDVRNDVQATALDQSADDFEAKLGALNPDIVIHTAGPYQGQDYRVARACIDCGSHYIDLADGREFVENFNQLNDDAKDRGLVLVTGASTLPGLSSAVIAELSKQFESVECIEISIAPAHQTPRGRSTIAAVMSYCGKPFKVLESGQLKTRYGWQNLRVQSYPVLGKRLSGICNVPDLSLLPQLFPGCETVTFHAALEAWWEQLALWVMAWFTRAGVVSNWDRYTTSFHQMSERLRNLGSDEGGMHLHMAGKDRMGNQKTMTWYLIARSNHGPEIPCSPALVLARKIIRGEIPTRGAIPCMGLMTLSEFAEEISGFDITWEFQT